MAAERRKTAVYPVTAVDIWHRVLGDFDRIPGTYRLFLLSQNMQETAQLGRLLGFDSTGTLYIGTSECLPVRITNLSRSIRTTYKLEGDASRPHSIWRKMTPGFTNAFIHERLRVEVHSYEAAENFNPYTEEWSLLMHYFENFGEFPPLNGINPSKIADEGSSLQDDPSA